MSPNGLKQNQTAATRRPVILMGILLVLLLGYFFREHFPQRPAPPAYPLRPAAPAPLKGENSITGPVAKQETTGRWVAEIDYFYNGMPRYAHLELQLNPANSLTKTLLAAQPGAHHVSIPLGYPGDAMITTAIVASLNSGRVGTPAIASKRVEEIIQWPSYETWLTAKQLAEDTPEQNVAHAALLIDANDLSPAKPMLEKLLEQNPQLDEAYVQLARIAMKSNWSAEGLHQAENLLGSALKIRPDSTNAKILLGYVYAHQRKFARAEGLFMDAAASKPRNLWLWANWGELLVMEGKPGQAIAKYREIIDRPQTHDRYNQARADAYQHLVPLLESRKDFDALEALYKQRLAEFGPGACYSADYARFMLQVRGDTQAAIDIARHALNQDCEDSKARQLLGLAEYVKWASTNGPEGAAALNQARVFLPVGAEPLYWLATSEHTIAAAKHLIADGESIDQKDREHLTALAYALQNHDFPAAKRLLALGASPIATVSGAGIPVALLPIMEEDIQGIRIMRQSGVDYSKLRYRGMTAFDLARRSGNSALLKALGDEAAVL